ncbi:MAG: hypothetical protein MZU91_06885 [Desulfosudis oleivorans]|nr:hypothetical protein [Desulfosudis oleivorans]
MLELARAIGRWPSRSTPTASPGPGGLRGGDGPDPQRRGPAPTGIGTLGYPGDAVIGKVAALVAAELGWDEARKAKRFPWSSRR